MTPQEIAGLGPTLTEFLQAFAGCFFRREVLAHFRGYGRGLLSDLPGSIVTPLAVAARRGRIDDGTTGAWWRGSELGPQRRVKREVG